LTDGRLVSASDDCSVRVWEAREGRLLQSFIAGAPVFFFSWARAIHG
jgi:hypothetical protein